MYIEKSMNKLKHVKFDQSADYYDVKMPIKQIKR